MVRRKYIHCKAKSAVGILETAAGKGKKALWELQENRKDVTNDWRRRQVFVGRELTPLSF